MKPIRATRENLLPGTIWQNAAGTDVIKIFHRGEFWARVGVFSECSIEDYEDRIDAILKSDIWYQVQPIKEAT